jgi:hypothetical protein
MTYTETIESLRCCFGFGTCSECKVKSMMKEDPLPCKLGCKEQLGLYAAELIERLTAENVALREGASLGKVKRSQKQAYEKQIKSLRALANRQASEIKKLQKDLCWKDLEVDGAEWKQERTEAERDALLGELRKSGCTYCKYATACVDELSVFGQEDCDRCGNRESCVCLTCSGYGSETDKWEWRGLPEAPEVE